MAAEHEKASLASIGKDIDTEKAEQLASFARNQYVNIGVTAEEAVFFDDFTDSQEHKKLLRKVDTRLIPLLALLYLAAHIDRANIGNAKIEGMEEDLKLTGYQYNIALSIFFIPYVLCEVPSNIILKRVKRPSFYLGTLVVLWGTIMTFTGLCTSFGGLVACRFLLGVFEAGFFPGAIYLINRWYGPRQLQTRIAGLYTASALSGAFSGLLAFAIAKMDGIGGRGGWAWIFILEGIVTVLFGVLCFFALPDSPILSKWMNDEERKYMEILAVIKNGGRSSESAEKFKWSLLREIVTDFKMWLQGFVLFMLGMCTYGLKFTMPSITLSMGYTSSQAQLLTIPPYVAGAIASVGLALLADRFQWRLPFVFGPISLVLVGFCILLALAPNISNEIPACYIAVMLLCIGQYPANPANYAWVGSNLAPDVKRAVGIAFHISVGNCGGILGSYMFLDSEEPGYPTGFSIAVGLTCCALVANLVLEFSYKSINRKRDAMDIEEIHRLYSDEQLARMGDKSPLYRYKL